MVMKVTLNSKAIKNYRSEFDICSTTHKLYEMDKFFYLPSRLVFFSFFFFFLSCGHEFIRGVRSEWVQVAGWEEGAGGMGSPASLRPRRQEAGGASQ